jgi:hypothetical protein
MRTSFYLFLLLIRFIVCGTSFIAGLSFGFTLDIVVLLPFRQLCTLCCPNFIDGTEVLLPVAASGVLVMYAATIIADIPWLLVAVPILTLWTVCQGNECGGVIDQVESISFVYFAQSLEEWAVSADD